MTPEWGRAVETFLEATAEVAAQDLVTLDEAGVNLGMTPSHARASRGERAYAVKPTNRGVNTTIIGALTPEGVTATMTVAGAVNREAFEVFVGEVLCPTLRAGQVVVMDNLKVHKGEGVRRLIEATGARVVFLPPYSPELNPIELCWSKVKAFLRRCGARTVEAVEAAIAQAFDSVTASDAHGWFAHCGYVAALK